MMGASFATLASLQNLCFVLHILLFVGKVLVQRSHATMTTTLGWRCLCQLASVCVCMPTFLWCTLQQDLVVLECRKEGAPGWEIHKSLFSVYEWCTPLAQGLMRCSDLPLSLLSQT